jgi:hypothetical protein
MVLTRIYRGSYRRGGKLDLVGQVIWDGKSHPWRKDGPYSFRFWSKGFHQRDYRGHSLCARLSSNSGPPASPEGGGAGGGIPLAVDPGPRIQSKEF